MRPEKKSMIDEFSGKIKEAEFVLLTDYTGLTVEKFAELRTELRGSESHMLVVKNSLLKLAAAEHGWEMVDDLLDGPVAMITGQGDITQIAKLLSEFIKKNEKPALKGGMVEGRTLTAADLSAMAKLPAREVLLGMMVGTVAAPMTQLVGVMNQKVSSLLYVLKAVEEKKNSEAN